MKEFSFSELLQATPYESMNNLSNGLTEDLFIKYLFVQTKQIDKIKNEILKLIIKKKGIRNVRAIFLEGYRGVGKTTFLRHFCKISPEFNFTFIDFFPSSGGTIKNESERTAARISLNEGIYRRGDDPLSINVKAYLRQLSFFDKSDFFRFLKVNCNKLYAFFTQCSSQILELCHADFKLIELQFNKILDTASFRDSFVLFFLFLSREEILNKNKTGNVKKIHIIAFDNLDAINLPNLSPFFREGFISALEDFSQVIQKSEAFSTEEQEYIDFDNTFKFMFCLRDSNNALMNAHKDDKLKQISAEVKVGNFESELYDTALQKRLDFFNSQNFLISKDLINILQVFREFAKDEFFRSIILPLFNWNFRSSTQAVLIALEELLEIKPNKYGLNIERKAKSSIFRYGKRGAIFFQIIKRLKDSDFLSKYPFVETRLERAVLEEEGYCVPLRVVLTYILNNSGINSVNEVINDRKPFQNITLRKIFDGLKDILTDEEIAETLFDMFNFHQKKWEHLITFRNYMIRSEKEEFIKEIVENANNHRERLYNIEIALNPAGFSCIKNLLVHFEFYSVIFDVSDKPLFLVGLGKTIVDDEEKYEFEVIIGNVLHHVDIHNSYMRTRFKKFFVGKRQMTQQQFLRSDYSFRHFEKGRNEKGLFHATRLAILHINYIDRFRRSVLKKVKSQAEKQRINKLLIGFIEKYNAILQDWEGLEHVKEEISNRLVDLKQGDYNDFETQINPQYK